MPSEREALTLHAMSEMPSETFNIPPASTVTLPLGLPDAALQIGVDLFMHSFILCVSLKVTFPLPPTHTITGSSRIVFISAQASYNTLWQSNEMIAGGLEAALGIITHPIYSVERQTRTYCQ